jgi:hypothetical protein
MSIPRSETAFFVGTPAQKEQFVVALQEMSYIS